MQRPFRAALAGAAIAALVTVPGLGNGTLWDNSETAYGEVAREILLTHDWVVMHLNGAPWFVQPPLYFWIAAICAKIFGVSSFALRLPSALATMGMGAVAGYAVTRRAGTRAGLYACVILSTCLMQAIVGRLAIMDALLDLAVMVSIFAWARALEPGGGRWLIAGCAAAGLGFLAKGPVAPVISLLVIVPYAIWQHRAAGIRLPRARAWIGGVAVFLAIVAPWFAALISRTGVHAAVVLIGHYTIGRYTGTIENQSGPAWYYVPVIILGFFPWIAFFPSAIAHGVALLHARRSADEPERRSLMRLAFVWMVLPFLFFSFAHTKLPNYIALEFPALSIAVAVYFEAVVERVRSRSALISTAAVPLTILMLAIAIVWFSHDNRLTGDLHNVAIDLIAVGAAIFVGSLATFVILAAARRTVPAPYVLGISMVLAVAFLALLALPQAERFKPVPHLARVIDAQRRPGDAVAIMDISGGNALLFYTRPPVYVLATPSPQNADDGVNPRGVICGASRVWLVVPRRNLDPAYGRNREIVAQWGKAQLLLYAGRDCS